MEKIDLKIQESLFRLSPDKYKPIFSDAEVYAGKPLKHKEKILKYLRSFEAAWFTSACIEDKVAHNQVPVANNLYNDGEYEWSASEVYHFEKYNMPLSNDFISYVLKQ